MVEHQFTLVVSKLQLSLSSHQPPNLTYNDFHLSLVACPLTSIRHTMKTFI
jgi:hypothetical protein